MMQINHIAIAVENIESVSKELATLFGIIFDTPIEVPEQQTKVAFGNVGGQRIELIEALSENSPLFPILPHPVLSFLKKHGQGVHHISFSVPDLSKALADYKQHGVEPLSADIEKGAEGLVAFLDPRRFGGLLIELCEVPKNES